LFGEEGLYDGHCEDAHDRGPDPSTVQILRVQHGGAPCVDRRIEDIDYPHGMTYPPEVIDGSAEEQERRKHLDRIMQQAPQVADRLAQVCDQLDTLTQEQAIQVAALCQLCLNTLTRITNTLKADGE
jgi:hypothetical protein